MAALAAAIPESDYGKLRSAIGSSPRQVFDMYGMPASNIRRGMLAPSVSGEETTLVQSYELAGGGRVGFLFSDNAVNGIVYDRLDGTVSPKLTDFFGSTDPRYVLMIACAQTDFFHVLDGETGPLHTLAAEWTTHSGGMFYAKYQLNSPLTQHYDPDAAAMKTAFPQNFDTLTLLQFGYFPHPGRTRIMDLHLTNLNADFSMAFNPSLEKCEH